MLNFSFLYACKSYAFGRLWITSVTNNFLKVVSMVLPSYPSTNRNKTYIVEVLKVYLPKTGTVLETASGTGEHINFFLLAVS